MEDCIFCKIASGKIPSARVYEDDDVIAFMDIGPISDGHTLVVPKFHCEWLHECPPEILGKLSGCLSRIAGAVQEAMGSEGYNVLCNNGRAAGQLVAHVHFHVIPRNSGDGVMAKWPSYKYPEGKAEQLAEKIRQKL